MTSDILGTHPGQYEALQALATELDRIGQSAVDKAARLSPKWGKTFSRIFKQEQSSWKPEELQFNYDGISAALRFREADGTKSFLYLGHFRDPKSGTFDDLMRGFEPTISLHLFDLGSDQNIAYALLLQEKRGNDPAPSLDVCMQYLAQVEFRASLLAVTARSLGNLIRDKIFAALLGGNNVPYLAWQREYIAARRSRSARIRANKPELIAEIESTTLMRLPAIVGHKLRPNQRTINGVYFPEEHEDFILKRLARMQAQAMRR